eukprot:TRINITY_DN2956_c0_g1_i3.p3 TRINITY_DN2956_c0_g1~~TRINITY_DN2956_c0_g1_i3.p3  ORF type:complete len:166 (-),score=25.64 TRINITY_DN2956_c0_g1_i3:187-684(-)
MEGSSTGTSLLTQSLQRLEEEDQAQEDRLCSSFQKLQVGFQNEEADADNNKYENGIEEQEKQLIVQSSSANLVTPQNPIPHKVGPADFELLRSFWKSVLGARSIQQRDIRNESNEQWPDFGCEGIKVQRAHQPTSQCQGKKIVQKRNKVTVLPQSNRQSNGHFQI